MLNRKLFFLLAITTALGNTDDTSLVQGRPFWAAKSDIRPWLGEQHAELLLPETSRGDRA